MARKTKIIVIGDFDVVQEFKRLSFQYLGSIQFVTEEKEADAIIDITEFDGTSRLEEEVEQGMKGIVKIQKTKKAIRKLNNHIKKNGSK